MTDTLDKASRSARMAKIKSRDTRPELVVRKLAHAMGYRYRLHRRDLPGSPDLAFSSRRKVIFVHGCFWHRHSDPTCKLVRLPKSRVEFWIPKFDGNVRRDEAAQHALAEAGWSALVIWECELRDRVAVESRIRSFLDDEVA